MFFRLTDPIRTTLTSAQVDAFGERGYHIQQHLFGEEEVTAIRDACEAVRSGTYETGCPPDGVGWRPGDDPLAVGKFDNSWKANRTVAAASLSPRLGHIAAQLISAPSIRIWHDQFLHKPPHGGRVVTFHQDWAYWQAIDVCRTVTCWIALDDVYPDSGPMILLEGSHKLGLQPLPQGISGEDPQEPALPGVKRVELIIRAGSVSFHHGLMMHGSQHNTSVHPRRALVSHLMSGECAYRLGQPHHNLKWMKTYDLYPEPGERFYGPQYPQLYP